tara:strand:+ start:1837 stop:2493 length:657 start_codon:yes stop_codon:yes gene_type:complete
MAVYPLHEPKDEHGQPLRYFKTNHDNNVSKAIDQLSGMCAGILADGVVCEKEARFFHEWIQKYSTYEPVWPFSEVLGRLETIFADGIISDLEREELKEVMQRITGNAKMNALETFSSALPLNNPLPYTISFPQNEFVITGRFAFGTRRKVGEAIEQRGGIVKNGTPTHSTSYLVIGVFASRDWYNTNYGRKIERAVELRSEGTPISIISEEHWKRFVA